MLMPRMEDNFGNKEYTTHNADALDDTVFTPIWKMSYFRRA